MRLIRWAPILLVLGAVLTIRAVPRVLQEYGAVPPEANTSDDAAAVIARYGHPDKDVTTPTMAEARPSRLLTYGGMEIVFVQRTYPSGTVWKLVGFLDGPSRMAISGDDALKRLLSRRKP